MLRRGYENPNRHDDGGEVVRRRVFLLSLPLQTQLFTMFGSLPTALTEVFIGCALFFGAARLFFGPWVRIIGHEGIKRAGFSPAVHAPLILSVANPALSSDCGLCAQTAPRLKPFILSMAFNAAHLGTFPIVC